MQTLGFSVFSWSVSTKPQVSLLREQFLVQRIISMASTAFIYALLTGLLVLLGPSFFETRFADSAHLESNKSKGALSLDENNPSPIAGLEEPFHKKPALLGVSMVTVKTNTLPPPKPLPLPLPDPK